MESRSSDRKLKPLPPAPLLRSRQRGKAALGENDPVKLHSNQSSFDSPEGREADARLRTNVTRLSPQTAAPLHSITSSARPSKGRGTVTPNAVAVFILMVSTTFVACWTGRSEGFSPLRIRPT